MIVDFLQVRCEHCDAIYILGLHDPPGECPDNARQIITIVTAELDTWLALQAIKAGMATPHEKND